MYLTVVHLFDSILVAAEHCTRADFVISPQFLFAGCAVDCQHDPVEVVIFSGVSVQVPEARKISPAVPSCSWGIPF